MCNQIQTKLADYSAQRLPLSKAESVRRHLESCDDCARFLRAESALMSGLAGLGFVEPRADLWGRVAADLDLREPVGAFGKLGAYLRGSRRTVAVAATGLVLAVGLATYSFRGSETPATSKNDGIPQIITVATNSPDVDDPVGRDMSGFYAALDKITK